MGESRYASDELVRAAGISVGDNMFMINKYDAANKLFAEHPYLDTVRIRRRLPDTLEIIVADCVPVAAVADGDGEEVWIADAKGKLLEKMGKDSPLCEGLIAVSGCDTAGAEAGKNLSEVDEKRAKPLFDILHMAENNDILNHISSVELEKLYQVTMGYSDRLSVRLGAPEELEKKFRFLVYIVEQLSVTDRGIIDVSDTAEARFIPQ